MKEINKAWYPKRTERRERILMGAGDGILTEIAGPVRATEIMRHAIVKGPSASTKRSVHKEAGTRATSLGQCSPC